MWTSGKFIQNLQIWNILFKFFGFLYAWGGLEFHKYWQFYPISLNGSCIIQTSGLWLRKQCVFKSPALYISTFRKQKFELVAVVRFFIFFLSPCFSDSWIVSQCLVLHMQLWIMMRSSVWSWCEFYSDSISTTKICKC